MCVTYIWNTLNCLWIIYILNWDLITGGQITWPMREVSTSTGIFYNYAEPHYSILHIPVYLAYITLKHQLHFNSYQMLPKGHK